MPAAVVPVGVVGACTSLVPTVYESANTSQMTAMVTKSTSARSTLSA